MPLGEGQRPGQEFVSQYSFPIEHKGTERVSKVAVSSAGQDIHKPGMFNEIVNHPSGLEVIRRANAILDLEFEFRITHKVDETPDHEVFKKTQFIGKRL